MIIPVQPHVFIGGALDCSPGLNLTGTKATIHACKYPCWARFTSSGQLPKDHPQYLAHIYPFDLILNMIDPPVPLFQSATFAMARTFAKGHLSRGRDLLIHCNQGLSRAPSIAMLILAKDLGVVSDESYERARDEFEFLYPEYEPGVGIEQYMREHWREL